MCGVRSSSCSGAIEMTLKLECMITELERQLRNAHATQRKGCKEAVWTQEQLAKELQHVKDGRVWASVREEQAKRRRVEAQRDELRAEVGRLNDQVGNRSRKHAAEMDLG